MALVGTKEHEDIRKSFEKRFSHLRLDKEKKDLWVKGQVYESGDTNLAWQFFQEGVSYGIAISR